MEIYITNLIKFFFVLAPFFVLTMFLALTKGLDTSAQRKVAIRVTISNIVMCCLIFFFGNAIFKVLGITLDSFRIGAGALLFLSGVSLVQGAKGDTLNAKSSPSDVSVVPLSIPVSIGPATVGVLMVMSASLNQFSDKLLSIFAICSSVCVLGILLYTASKIKDILGNNGIEILTKLSGLVLAALAAQIVFTGVKNFLA